MDNIENQDGEGINKYDQDKIDQLKEQANQRAKYKKEMMANEAIQKYLEGFNSGTIENFVDFYSARKLSWKEHGADWRKSKEKEEEQWINAAFDHLGYIQQKKLFDLQCLWRADQIKLPGIEITWDFKMWEHQNILACPFLDPITEADIDLYQSYLLQENRDEEEFHYDGWQDYDRIKETQNSEENCFGRFA